MDVAQDFDKAITIILQLEDPGLTGRVNNDEGGLTKFGVSKKAYPSTDIASLTLDQAKSLYHSDYWNAVSADGLPWPISLFVFDAAVNQGKDAAIRMLQQELEVAIDGIFGLNTARAVLKANAAELAINYLSRRAMRYMGTRDFDKNGKGWLNRINRLARAAYAS